jgi:hypothetical protein
MQRVIPQNERETRAAGRHRWRPQDVSDVSRYCVAYRCDLRASADDWSVADNPRLPCFLTLGWQAALLRV